MLQLHIAMWHPKGGTGKSTTGLNLAGYIHHVLGKKVVYWDRDEQKSGRFLATITNGIGYGFPIITEADPSHDDAEIVITDHAPRMEKPIIIGKTVVVIPVKPVLIEAAPWAQGVMLVTGECDAVVSVVTRYNGRRSEQVNSLRELQVPADPAPNLRDAPIIADRSIYERASGMGTSIFSPQLDRLYGVREARAEIASLWKKIQEKTNVE